LLARLRNMTSLGAVPSFPTERVTFLDGDRWDLEDGKSSSYSVFVQRNMPPGLLLQIPEARSAAQALIQAGVVPVPTSKGSDGDAAECYNHDELLLFLLNRLSAVIAEYLEVERTLEFQPEKFISAFERCKADWITPITTKFTVPLLGFESECAHTALKSNLDLEPFSAEEKTEAFSTVGREYSFFSVSEFISTRYRLFATWSAHMNVSEQAARDARTTITAMRLLHAGKVGTHGTIVRATDRRGRQVGGWTGTINDCGVEGWLTYTPPYRCTPDDLQAINHRICQLSSSQALEKGHEMSLALRRFNQSYARKLREDKLIDITIALESVLLTETRNELAYRLAMRGAALLRQLRNPEETYGFLKALYGVRSIIVHEGKGLSDPAIARELKGVPHKVLHIQAEDTARLILCRYLDGLGRGKSIKTQNRELDRDYLKAI